MTAAVELEAEVDGLVAPRWATARNLDRPTYGAHVAAVSEVLGRPFMPHQRAFVDVMLEVQSEDAGDDEPGEWAYDDGLFTVQRRGGKTAIIAPASAHRARMIRRARVFMTAQNRETARKRWMDVTDDLLGSVLRDDVRRLVARMGEELRWRDERSVLEPFAPNEDALHSETPDLVFIDELWAFDAEQKRQVQAGYVPAFSTTSGQAIKMSTAGTERSIWLNDAIEDGRAAVEGGVQRGICHVEYGVPDRVGGTSLKHLTDSELVEACIAFHPAVCHVVDCPGARGRRPCPHGFTVRPAAIRSAWSTFSGDSRRSEFLRAYGNRSAGDMVERWRVLTAEQWRDQVEPDGVGIPALAPFVLGVWVDEDALDAAVASGWRDAEGRMHVEHLQLDAGVRWVRDYVAGVAERQPLMRGVAIANTGHARDVADALEQSGLTVQTIAQADVAAACSRHKTELVEGAWFHRKHSAATDAAASAAWRKVGAGGVWTRPGDSISALGAQTLAGWGWDHAPKPARKRKFKVR